MPEKQQTEQEKIRDFFYLLAGSDKDTINLILSYFETEEIFALLTGDEIFKSLNEPLAEKEKSDYRPFQKTIAKTIKKKLEGSFFFNKTNVEELIFNFPDKLRPKSKESHKTLKKELIFNLFDNPESEESRNTLKYFYSMFKAFVLNKKDNALIFEKLKLDETESTIKVDEVAVKLYATLSGENGPLNIIDRSILINFIAKKIAPMGGRVGCYYFSSAIKTILQHHDPKYHEIFLHTCPALLNGIRDENLKSKQVALMALKSPNQDYSRATVFSFLHKDLKEDPDVIYAALTNDLRTFKSLFKKDKDNPLFISYTVTKLKKRLEEKFKRDKKNTPNYFRDLEITTALLLEKNEFLNQFFDFIISLPYSEDDRLACELLDLLTEHRSETGATQKDHFLKLSMHEQVWVRALHLIGQKKSSELTNLVQETLDCAIYHISSSFDEASPSTRSKKKLNAILANNPLWLAVSKLIEIPPSTEDATVTNDFLNEFIGKHYQVDAKQPCLEFSKIAVTCILNSPKKFPNDIHRQCYQSMIMNETLFLHVGEKSANNPLFYMLLIRGQNALIKFTSFNPAFFINSEETLQYIEEFSKFLHRNNLMQPFNENIAVKFFRDEAFFLKSIEPIKKFFDARITQLHKKLINNTSLQGQWIAFLQKHDDYNEKSFIAFITEQLISRDELSDFKNQYHEIRASLVETKFVEKTVLGKRECMSEQIGQTRKKSKGNLSPLFANNEKNKEISHLGKREQMPEQSEHPHKRNKCQPSTPTDFFSPNKKPANNRPKMEADSSGPRHR